jgi:Arc/MetJ-type ribon-helix-helix transcriptional regulator
MKHRLVISDLAEGEREARLECLRREIQKGLDSGPATSLDIDALLKECQAQFGDRLD